MSGAAGKCRGPHLLPPNSLGFELSRTASWFEVRRQCFGTGSPRREHKLLYMDLSSRSEVMPAGMARLRQPLGSSSLIKESRMLWFGGAMGTTKLACSSLAKVATSLMYPADTACRSGKTPTMLWFEGAMSTTWLACSSFASAV